MDREEKFISDKYLQKKDYFEEIELDYYIEKIEIPTCDKETQDTIIEKIVETFEIPKTYKECSEEQKERFKKYLLEELNENDGATCVVCGGSVYIEDGYCESIEDFIDLKHCCCEDDFDINDCFDCRKDCGNQGLTRSQIERLKNKVEKK